MPYTAAEMKRLDAGRCAKCGKYPHKPGRTECGKCTSGRIATRTERLAKGMCGNCGERPPRPGKTECEQCAAHRAAKLAAKKKHKITAAKSGKESNLCATCKTTDKYKTESLCKQCFMRAGWAQYKIQLRSIQQEDRCAVCQEPIDPNLIELDHVKPSSGGGSDSMWNLEVLCIECNRAKGNRKYLGKDDVRDRMALRRERVKYVRDRIKAEYDM